MRHIEHMQLLDAQPNSPLGDTALFDQLRPPAILLSKNCPHVPLHAIATAATNSITSRSTQTALQLSPELLKFRTAVTLVSDIYQKGQVTEAIRLVARYFMLRKIAPIPQATLGDLLNLSAREIADLFDFSQKSYPRRNVIQAAFVLVLFSPD